MATVSSRSNAITHAGVIVVRRHNMILEYLFVTTEQDPGQWVFPKGRIEPGESPDAAALREVKEEAGVAAKIIEKLPSLDLATNSIAMFLMWPVDCTATSEGRQIQWFGVDQALIQLTFDESRQLLRKVHSRMLSRITLVQNRI